MKNKINLKKCLLWVSVTAVLFFMGFAALSVYQYRIYTRNYNYKLDAIFSKVKEKYPEVTAAELIEILNSDQAIEHADVTQKQGHILEKYGIDLEKDSVILENERDFRYFLAGNLMVLSLLVITIVILFLRYNWKIDRELKRITEYIEEINRKNYRLEIEDMSEDELSMLKTEIYKTTIMLKETAENSVKDKNYLRESLSDISHQLKTPLTSILIILDNLIDDSDMDADVRADFIRDIKREIGNINFLVQSLLKMAKLDSETVAFIKEEVSLGDVAEAAIRNVSTLCDLKEVTIEKHYMPKDLVKCDFRWQVEGVTNILKNCVEHSKAQDKVIIRTQWNKIYASITIQDFGAGIDEEDQKHIFERFYKGKNASKDSVGIGLALAKSIVESDNGRINVKSDSSGTTFTVKYFY